MNDVNSVIPRWHLAAVVMSLTALAAGLGGCAAANTFIGRGSSIRVQSLGEQRVAVEGRYETSIYSDASGVETTFMLADAPIKDLLDGTVTHGQVLHLELLWQPRAGWTPVGGEATNASVRYIVLADGEIGIYGGAGFASIGGEVGSEQLSVSLHDASLKLLERTDGFVDLLTPAEVTGSFTADHDPTGTRQLHFGLSQMVTDVYGRSIFVLDQPFSKPRLASTGR